MEFDKFKIGLAIRAASEFSIDPRKAAFRFDELLGKGNRFSQEQIKARLLSSSLCLYPPDHGMYDLLKRKRYRWPVQGKGLEGIIFKGFHPSDNWVLNVQRSPFILFLVSVCPRRANQLI